MQNFLSVCLHSTYDVNSIYYEKVSEWPICVKSCPRKLTYIPRNETGLTGIVPQNTIPSGQFGSYICIDSTLGVNQVGTSTLRCLILNNRN